MAPELRPVSRCQVGSEAGNQADQKPWCGVRKQEEDQPAHNNCGHRPKASSSLINRMPYFRHSHYLSGCYQSQLPIDLTMKDSICLSMRANEFYQLKSMDTKKYSDETKKGLQKDTLWIMHWTNRILFRLYFDQGIPSPKFVTPTFFKGQDGLLIYFPVFLIGFKVHLPRSFSISIWTDMVQFNDFSILVTLQSKLFFLIALHSNHSATVGGFSSGKLWIFGVGSIASW